MNNERGWFAVCSRSFHFSAAKRVQLAGMGGRSCADVGVLLHIDAVVEDACLLL